MHTKEWESSRCLLLCVHRGDDRCSVERRAAVARGYVVGFGHLPTHAAMHPETGAELDLVSHFERSDILPGASGKCHCVEESNHRRDAIMLFS
jgi:hypothetical protein